MTDGILEIFTTIQCGHRLLLQSLLLFSILENHMDECDVSHRCSLRWPFLQCHPYSALTAQPWIGLNSIWLWACKNSRSLWIHAWELEEEIQEIRFQTAFLPGRRTLLLITHLTHALLLCMCNVNGVLWSLQSWCPCAKRPCNSSSLRVSSAGFRELQSETGL